MSRILHCIDALEAASGSEELTAFTARTLFYLLSPLSLSLSSGPTRRPTHQLGQRAHGSSGWRQLTIQCHCQSIQCASITPIICSIHRRRPRRRSVSPFRCGGDRQANNEQRTKTALLSGLFSSRGFSQTTRSFFRRRFASASKKEMERNFAFSFGAVAASVRGPPGPKHSRFGVILS